MSEYRKQIGVAVTIALVGALSLAIIANYSFPTQPGRGQHRITDEFDLPDPLAILRADRNLAIAKRVNRPYHQLHHHRHHVSRAYLNREWDNSLANSRQWS